ncbi:hypothetical protein, partial [Nocardia neocaledoniensis]|uniref:hypothetical protein n=1 Tax=Nocardia neocaledoniensis TaxID=236511 RepID=UPI0024576B0C
PSAATASRAIANRETIPLPVNVMRTYFLKYLTADPSAVIGLAHPTPRPTGEHPGNHGIYWTVVRVTL